MVKATAKQLEKRKQFVKRFIQKTPLWWRQNMHLVFDGVTLRYGERLGDKVSLWGGFTGDGVFALRLWTATPKMKKEAWAQHIPQLKRAAAMSASSGGCKKFKMWHDNEKFIQLPKEYKTAGLTSINFPPNSRDLSPIETLWAKLRKDLIVKEFEDQRIGRIMSKKAFKQRVAQLLNSYSIPGPGAKHSFLEGLVRGMPQRLEKCKANKYGPCLM